MPRKVVVHLPARHPNEKWGIRCSPGEFPRAIRVPSLSSGDTIHVCENCLELTERGEEKIYFSWTEGF